MDLVQENLENLTSLWKIAGQKAGKYWHTDQFSMSFECNSDWPNRLWFNKAVDADTIVKAIDLMGSNHAKITMPIWGENLSYSTRTLEKLGFNHKFSQVGMSIILNQDFNASGKVRLEKVSNELSAKLWSLLFEKSFGYLIAEETIMKTYDEITYLIGFYGDEPVGTSVLYFHHPTIAGIHSMGIIPEQRRKGFAEEMLRHQLNMATRSGARYATLQASDMGKGLYLKLGFQEQFIIKNFTKF
jgi:ribosomal protein S18 acetylase RimI-like enzyme